jgi:hypothetical protein
MYPPRPFLVGLVCWVVIISGASGLYLTMKQLGGKTFTSQLAIYPYPPLVAGIILFGTMVLPVICAICMYEGQGWARYVYLALTVPFFVQGHLAIPLAKDPDWAQQIWIGELVLVVLSAVILFLPKARRFFRPPVYLDE